MVSEGLAQYSEAFFKCNVCFEGFSDENILELHATSCHSFNSTESTPKSENENGLQSFEDSISSESTPNIENENGFHSFEDSSSTESTRKSENENGFQSFEDSISPESTPKIENEFHPFEDGSTTESSTPKMENVSGLFFLKDDVAGPRKNNRSFPLEFKLQVIQEAKKSGNRPIGKKHAFKKYD